MEKEQTNSPARLPALTGIRGVAALWVVLFHVFQGRGAPIPIVSVGYAGVDMFFILSGFVLSHVYFDDKQTVTLAGYFRFLGVRLARIYPLHLFILCCLGCIAVGLPGFADAYANPQARFSGSAFVASLFLVQNWGGWIPGNWNGPAWSLSAEWFAYMAFPVLLTVIRPVWSSGILIAGAIGALIATAIALHIAGYTDTDGMGRAGMVRMAGEFTAGCLVYAAFRRGRRISPAVGPLAALALFLVATIFDRAEFLILFSFAALIALAAQGNNVVSVLLGRKICVFLGEISFSVYLLHWIILQLLNFVIRRYGHFGGDWVEVPIALLAVGTLSIATYRWIERPARSLGRRLAAKDWTRHGILTPQVNDQGDRSMANVGKVVG